MKKTLITLFAFLPFFFSCKSNSITPTDAANTNQTSSSTSLNDCNFDSTLPNNLGNVLSTAEQNQYLAIWKKQFMQRNGFSEAFFQSHIKKYVISSQNWNAGTSFRIDYLLDYSWISFKCKDTFMVKMNSSYDLYRQYNIPRDIFLAENYIQLLLDKNIESSVTKINPHESLKFNSCAEVITYLKSNSKYGNIVLEKGVYIISQPDSSAKGNPFITVYGVLNSSQNTCLFGYIDLKTGTFDLFENKCTIIN